MASAGRLFGAALLNALGKGAEGAAKGYEDARNYALKKATAEADLIPSSIKELANYEKLDPERQQTFLDIKTAGGGTTVKRNASGGITKTPPPRDRGPTKFEVIDQNSSVIANGYKNNPSGYDPMRDSPSAASKLQAAGVDPYSFAPPKVRK